MYFLRPARGAPRVVPVTILTATSGFNSQGYDVSGVGERDGGSQIAVYDIFVGASAVVLSFLGPERDESPTGLNLGANSSYSATWAGIHKLRFRSAVVNATVQVVVTPMVFMPVVFSPATLHELEELGIRNVEHPPPLDMSMLHRVGQNPALGKPGDHR